MTFKPLETLNQTIYWKDDMKTPQKHVTPPTGNLKHIFHKQMLVIINLITSLFGFNIQLPTSVNFFLSLSYKCSWNWSITVVCSFKLNISPSFIRTTSYGCIGANRLSQTSNWEVFPQTSRCTANKARNESCSEIYMLQCCVLFLFSIKLRRGLVKEAEKKPWLWVSLLRYSYLELCRTAL